MNNANMPAMPYTVKPSKECLEQSAGNGVVINDKNYLGLTKREHFAGLAMQGFIASCGNRSVRGNAPELAVEYADALLTELTNQRD
jgi:hypothetical protein